jgi:hypothetical protein
VNLVFSTVIRSAPLTRCGEVVVLDWDSKKILKSTYVGPSDPTVRDNNPRGNTRGGRGIRLDADSVYVACYDKVDVFDNDLTLRRRLTNGLTAGLHETLLTTPDSLWVAATALDAAIEIGLDKGEVRDSYWPRENTSFQNEFGLPPGGIDPSGDYRGTFSSERLGAQPGHLHLNALAKYEGEMLALFNRLGAIANLDRGTVLVRDPELQRGHNLEIVGDLVVTNATRHGEVHVYDLRKGDRVRTIRLRDYEWVRESINPSLGTRGLRKARKMLGRPDLANPLFLRGMDIVDNRLFVGFSPAAIVSIDLESGEMLDGYQHSTDVRECVHGLRVGQR